MRLGLPSVPSALSFTLSPVSKLPTRPSAKEASAEVRTYGRFTLLRCKQDSSRSRVRIWVENTCVILSHTSFFGVKNRNKLSACCTRKIAEKNFRVAIIKLINDFYSDLHVERMTVQKRVKFTIDRMKTILVCVATQLLLCIPCIPVHAGYFLTKR